MGIFSEWKLRRELLTLWTVWPMSCKADLWNIVIGWTIYMTQYVERILDKDESTFNATFVGVK